MIKTNGRIKVEGPFSRQTLIDLHQKSAEIVGKAVNASMIIKKALCAKDTEESKKAAKKFSKVCKEGIETIKTSFPEALVNQSSNYLIESLEESVLSGEALAQEDEKGFSQHFQQSTELMNKHNMFLEQLENSLREQKIYKQKIQ